MLFTLYVILNGKEVGGIENGEMKTFDLVKNKNIVKFITKTPFRHVRTESKEYSFLSKTGRYYPISVRPESCFKDDKSCSYIKIIEDKSHQQTKNSLQLPKNNILEIQAKALKVISDFAKEICGEIPLKGTHNNLDLSGKAKAGLGNVVKKVVALGIDGAAKYQTGEYNGLLQTDLLKSLSESKNCRLKVCTDLKEKLL